MFVNTPISPPNVVGKSAPLAGLGGATRFARAQVAFSTMTVRIGAATEATPELRDALARLLPQLNASLPIPSLEHLAEVVADPAVTLLVGRDDALIAGVATVVVYTTPIWLKARIEDVVVDQAARGRGVGEALVRECIEVARRRGAGIVELQSARSREAANRLYPRLGFALRDSNVYRLTLR
jgi:ribosomal protein S18 acetylase RimI-like enzyme